MEFIINLILSCFHTVYTESTKQSSSDSMLSGINHNVDELLVGLVTQIKLRKENQTDKSSKEKVRNIGNNVEFVLITFILLQIFDFFGRVLSLQIDKNKSCSNLNIL